MRDLHPAVAKVLVRPMLLLIVRLVRLDKDSTLGDYSLLRDRTSLRLGLVNVITLSRNRAEFSFLELVRPRDPSKILAFLFDLPPS